MGTHNEQGSFVKPDGCADLAGHAGAERYLVR